MSFFQNTCKPEGCLGRIMLKFMNLGHSGLHKWGFKHLKLKDGITCLDVGCGGGSNLKRILKLSDNNKAIGIDYSIEAVNKSLKTCKKYVSLNRCEVKQMNILDLEFENNTFDLVTAFETIYFWKNLEKAFRNIYDVLKDGGEFFICNESNGKCASQEKWTKIIKGMKIYKPVEIKNILTMIGFKDIMIDDSYKTWLTISAKK